MRFLSLSLSLLLGVCLAAQPRQVQTLSIAEGLAQSQVYALIADRQGHIWAGTQGGGLSSFDGRQFITYTEFDGLAGNYIHALWEDPAGDIWIGTNKGVSLFDGRRFSLQLAWDGVVAIAGNNTSVYILTEGALFCYQSDCWEEVPLPEELEYRAIALQGERLVLGTDQGVWARESGDWHQLDQPDRRPPEIWNLSGARSAVWAASPDRGIYRVGEAELSHLSVPGRVLTGTYHSSAGDFWVTTQSEGVYVKPASGTEWIHLSERDGLGSNQVWAITEDAWGNIWLGTSGGGISSVRQAPFRAFDQQLGLPGRQVYAVSGSEATGVVFSVGSGALMRMGGDRPLRLQLDSLLDNVKIKALDVDEKGRIWIGTEGDGLLVRTPAGWHRINDCGSHILHVAIEDTTSVWVAAAYRGVSNLSLEEDSLGFHWSTAFFQDEDQLPGGRVESMHLDQEGRLLLGFRNRGLACWRPDSLYWHLRQGDGLSAEGVRAMREDSTGYLWLATAGGLGCLFLYDSLPQPESWSRRDGLQSSNIYSVEVDQEQAVWIGSERGVEKLELNAERRIRQISTYRSTEGFTGIETCTDAAYCDEAGNLWFGTMNGLMLHENVPFNPGKVPPPLLQLADIRVDFQSVLAVPDQRILGNWGRVEDTLRLPYNRNHLGFTLTAIDQARPDAIRYQWRLLGWEALWNPPSEQRLITYANLPPGDYRLQARAVGAGERISGPIELVVVISPPFWQTRTFRTLAVIGLSLLLLSIIALWARRWKRRQQAVEERLRLNNKLLELEQKALQLQMNPHFIANALQGIQHQVKEGALQRADQYLYKFGALMRSVLYHSRTNRITLSDEIENLRHYLDLEQFRLNDSFRYSIHYDEELETDLIHIPPMLLQPFLENAIHHGLKGLDKEGVIQLHFTDEGERIRVLIEDNGRGLQASGEDRSPDHQSTALKVIRERLETLSEGKNAAFTIEEIKKDEDILGVTVTVYIPVLG